MGVMIDGKVYLVPRQKNSFIRVPLASGSTITTFRRNNYQGTSRLENESQMQRRVQTAVTKLNDEQERAGAYTRLQVHSKSFASLFSWHSYRSGLCCALFAVGCPDAINQLICRWMCPESLLAYRRMGAPPRTARGSRRRRTRRSTPHAKRQRAPGRPRRVRCRAIRLHGQI
jgi:hypothetical protein